MLHGSIHRRRLLMTGLAWPAWAVGQGVAGEAQGAAGVIDGAWRDEARQREVAWRARWPSGEGACPLVLYSHGLGGNREGGDVWGQAWRAAGLAVLHLQHVGSDTEVLHGGLRTLRAAASAEQLVERVRDVRFALDELARRAAAGEAPWARVRADAIGLAGHSFGAHTAQAVAGQRYRKPADLADARPRAFVAFSPSAGRGDALAPGAAFAGITRPFLAVTGSRDGEPLGGAESGEPRLLVHQGLPPGRRGLLWLDGADHMTFAGNAGRRIRGNALLRRDRAAEQAEPHHHALLARLTSLWWQAQLLGDATARAALAAATGLGPQDRLQLD